MAMNMGPPLPISAATKPPGRRHSRFRGAPSLDRIDSASLLPSEATAQNAQTHAQNQAHSHNHGTEIASSHRANTSLRRNPPPSLSQQPDGANPWTIGATSGGRALITPKAGSFDAAVKYEAPAVQAHDHHGHDHGQVERSSFTKLLLPYTSRWPLLHSIMTEKDSRRIFYFMGYAIVLSSSFSWTLRRANICHPASLNLSFMLIQAFYGYITDSLGLLSDSIHMFFDCVALAVGLFASVAAKWPPSERFPYGFGKIETLSGFGNGVFLMLISIEIIFEACERILEGRETKRLTELFIVSSLGLAVNLVGMLAFGHHHHHGDHEHGHGHEHSHAHGAVQEKHGHGSNGHGHDHHGHDHSHEHEHEHNHNTAHSHEHKHDHAHDHADHHHGHRHDNENMYGIYLHVLADTLGSAAVIASTVLTHFIPWAGWDPLASFLIAILILLSSFPLVTSSARRLLLTIPDDVEYTLRTTLSGISGLRGVAGYSVPKFWMDDRGGGSDGTRLLGVVHVVAVRGAEMEEVRERTRAYLGEHGIEATVQVEREGDSSCWCGVGKSPLSAMSSGLL
jgi:solute carrier family 30 (zinc transporter), member 5/7